MLGFILFNMLFNDGVNCFETNKRLYDVFLSKEDLLKQL